jgi:hypothetical protein
MDWRQIAKGWQWLAAKVAYPQSPVQEIDSQADHSTLAAFSGGDDGAQMTPCIPDSHRERNDSSLHLSC